MCALGIGDDAALLRVPARCAAGRRRPTRWWPECTSRRPHRRRSIGHRALAVNLSDLAAMGARPAWALLALTLPEADEAWLAEFAAGLAALAREPTTWRWSAGTPRRGPLCVTVQLLGFVPRGRGADARRRTRRRSAVRVAARPAMPARDWHCCRGGSRRRPRRRPTCASASSRRRRAWRSASSCVATPAPASTCPTACSAMPASSRRRAAAALSWSSRPAGVGAARAGARSGGGARARTHRRRRLRAVLQRAPGKGARSWCASCRRQRWNYTPHRRAACRRRRRGDSATVL